MSIAVVVKVSEGLVLGADSAATLQGRLQSSSGIQEGILKTYFNAKKLLQVGDFPIGILAWGQGYVGARTVESLVREWEHTNHWQSQEEFGEKHSDTPYSVRDCAEGLLNHLSQLHTTEYSSVPVDRRPQLGVIVAGYSAGQFFPEIWRFVVPLDSEPQNQRPDCDGKPDFGASWFGLTDAIVRLHWGRDDAAIKLISEKFGVSQDSLVEALQPLQYPIPFAVMPLQDAIEYTDYVLNVVVGRFRFVLGPELCGGPIEIAAITQRDFTWISRKTWRLQS
jgi:hypothetical protein